MSTKGRNKIVLEKIRGSWVFVDEPRMKDDKPVNYGMQILIPKDHPQIKTLRKLELSVLNDHFGPDASKKKGRYKLPLRDGDAELESGEKEGEEYRNHWFLNANCSLKTKPGIGIVRNGSVEIADEDDIRELCFSGAYFTVSISFYKMTPDDGGKAGLAVYLKNVLLVKKGKRLDGSLSAKEEFAGINVNEYENDEDDFDDEDFDDDDDDELDDW